MSFLPDREFFRSLSSRARKGLKENWALSPYISSEIELALDSLF
jgi:hypothetical protein